MNEFQTQDINLATYLKVNNIQLLRIEPIDTKHVYFVFEEPAPQIINDWISRNPSGSVRSTINCYRHLLRDAREVQRELVANLGAM